MSLRETQQLMWTLIAAPEGVADGLRQIDKKPAELEQLLRGDARLNAVQRLDIYANMYFFRLYEILQEDYPAVRASVGDRAFYRLCTDYLAACPSQHPSVRNVGERLAAFLPTHPLGRERPWLAALAALERARREVFDGPDADVLTLDELRTRPPETFAALELPLVPSRAWVLAEHAVDDVWAAVESAGADEHEPADEPAQAHELGDGHEPSPEHAHAHVCDGHEHHDDAAPISEPQAGARKLLVWRQDLDVYHRPVPELEQQALARAEAGATFGVICELIAEHMTMEAAAPAAFQMLAAWVQDGLIARR